MDQTQCTGSSSFSDLFLFLFQRGATTTFNVMLAQVNHVTFFQTLPSCQQRMEKLNILRCDGIQSIALISPYMCNHSMLFSSISSDLFSTLTLYFIDFHHTVLVLFKANAPRDAERQSGPSRGGSGSYS